MSDNLDDSRRYRYQASVVCDGCEGIRDVHYVCLDCHGNLCNACKERHPNVRLTKNHTVLPRGHPAVIELRLAKRKRNIPCRKHNDSDYVTYCIKCNIPCCAICMIEDHAGHEVTKFEDVEEDVRQALTKYGENLEKELLPQAVKITKELKQRKSTSTEQLQKHKNQVRRRASDLQKRVTDLYKEAEDKLDEMYNTEVESLDDLIKTSEEKSKMMSELVDNCNKTVDKANTVEMSLLLSDSPAELATLLPKVILPPSTIFTESSYEIHDYTEVVGRVKEDEERKILFDPVNLDIKLLKPEVKIELAAPDNVALSSPPEPESFIPDMIQTSKEGEFSTSITPFSMARTDNDEVLIGVEGGSLALYDEAGNQKQTTEKTFDIYDITLTASQDIIATDYTNKSIVRISRSGDVTFLRSTSSLEPCGICINDRQQLVVGLRKGYREKPIKLMVYSSDGGCVVQEMERDGDDKALFNRYIYRVRQNGNGDYVVIEGDTLVCLTHGGSLRWRHGRWTVTGVECDRNNCNVIYCDYFDGVTMLDRDGGLIRQLLTPRKDGIVLPRSLSLDRQGRLWIGLLGKRIQIWKYLK